MICHLCQESIESGEACIPERLNNSAYHWFFHPECYAKVQEERRETEQRAENVRRMAGFVH